MLRPDIKVEENVLIDVIRNPSAPIFGTDFYTRTVAESVAQGSSVLAVTATDSDGVSTAGTTTGRTLSWTRRIVFGTTGRTLSWTR